MNKSKKAAAELGTLHGPVNRPMKGLFKTKKKDYNEPKCPDTEPEKPIKQLKNFKQHIGGTRSLSKPKDKVQSKLPEKQERNRTNINSKNSSKTHYTSDKLYYKPSSKSPVVSNLRSTSIQKEVKSNLSSNMQVKADEMMKKKPKTKKQVNVKVIKDDANKQHHMNVKQNGKALSKQDARKDVKKDPKNESKHFVASQKNIILPDGSHKQEEPLKSLSESIKKANIPESKIEEPKAPNQEDVKAPENPEPKAEEQNKEEKQLEVKIEQNSKSLVVNQVEQPQEEHKSQSVPNSKNPQQSSESSDPSSQEKSSEIKGEGQNMDKYAGKTEEEVAEMFIEENTVKEGEFQPINEAKKEEEEEPQKQQPQEQQNQQPQVSQPPILPEPVQLEPSNVLRMMKGNHPSHPSSLIHSDLNSTMPLNANPLNNATIHVQERSSNSLPPSVSNLISSKQQQSELMQYAINNTMNEIAICNNMLEAKKFSKEQLEAINHFGNHSQKLNLSSNKKPQIIGSNLPGNLRDVDETIVCQWKVEQDRKENERRRKELEENSKKQPIRLNGNNP